MYGMVPCCCKSLNACRLLEMAVLLYGSFDTASIVTRYGRARYLEKKPDIVSFPQLKNCRRL
jgi:hypothetical protein